MIGTVTAQGMIEAISGRRYTFTAQDVVGEMPGVGDRVTFNPQGGTASDVQRTGGGAPRGRGNATVASSTGGRGPNDKVQRALNELPYDFVPVHPELAVTDSPVFHDGKSGATEERISGELRLTLRALTPLLPGNYRYVAKDVRSPQNGEVRLPNEFGIDFPVAEDKGILEPLRDPSGRVLIGGSALTGMLRQDLGALLSAPMERVTERSYSYRPNLGHARQGNARREVRPAVVESISGSGVTLRIFSRARAASFVRGDGTTSADRLFRRIGAPGAGTPVTRRIPEVRFDNHNHLAPGGSCDVVNFNHYYATYKGGIDGTGELARRFGRGQEIYRHALIPSKDWTSAAIQTVPTDVLEHYRRTQNHLVDRESGHISSRHPLLPKTEEGAARAIGRYIRDNQSLESGQLVYVEVDVTGGPLKVLSMGHHFHYRWCYTDTVHTRWHGTRKAFVRPILKPLDSEQVAQEAVDSKKDAAPRQLSGARLFFGYTSTQEENPGACRVGSGNFSRLAGRLAFNIAVEQTDNPEDASRFLNSGKAIALKVLGMPRPSAVEVYVDQEGAACNLLNTYGDLPGEAGAELRGRGHYPHQAQATYDLRSELAQLDRDQTLKRSFVDSVNRYLSSQIDSINNTSLRIGKYSATPSAP